MCFLLAGSFCHIQSLDSLCSLCVIFCRPFVLTFVARTPLMVPDLHGTCVLGCPQWTQWTIYEQGSRMGITALVRMEPLSLESGRCLVGRNASTCEKPSRILVLKFPTVSLSQSWHKLSSKWCLTAFVAVGALQNAHPAERPRRVGTWSRL